MRIYLDNCCYNRPFDDQSQLKIKIKTEAKLYIQQEILNQIGGRLLQSVLKKMKEYCFC